MNSTRKYRFYGAEISYFSGKLRPFFRYKDIPCEEIAVTPAVYRDIIIPRTGLAFIPVVITPDDETLQDTSDILDELERRFPEPPIYPPTPVQRSVAYLLEVYADEFGILPAMHYRWSFAESEAKARADFARATGQADSANAFADRMKGSLPLLGIHAETIPAIEAHTRDLLSILSQHFDAHDFLLGSRMSLADLALLGPLYAHLYLDAVPGRLLRETAPHVCAWIERMNHPRPRSGTFVADDEIPATLLPLLKLVGSDAVPLLLDDIRAFETWADSKPADLAQPPRGVGMHRTALRGVSFERFTSPYTLWMVQRPLDAYRALTPAAQARVRRTIDGTGLDALLDFEPRYRLGKRAFQLVVELRGQSPGSPE
ncbi:MAG: glutathione S-transferase family protein [Candidatus Binatia bacterium]